MNVEKLSVHFNLGQIFLVPFIHSLPGSVLLNNAGSRNKHVSCALSLDNQTSAINHMNNLRILQFRIHGSNHHPRKLNRLL